MNIVMAAAGAVLFLILAPVLGGLISGVDRVLTARMQSRRGPPVLQPFYDISKLWHKERAFANPVEMILTSGYLILIAFSGAILFSGGDLLLVVFALALSHTFLILAAYAANAPYSTVGAERELIGVMVAEPILILLAAGFFIVTGSFFVSDIVSDPTSAIVYLPGVFLALFAVLTLKLRKSPFDIATSHHAHQELVKGVTSSLSGRTLAKVELAHWYETIILLAMMLLFFAANPVLGIIVVVICYFLEILMDNLFPRVTWKMTMKSLWTVTLILGAANIAVLGILGGVMV
ncbi:NADH-quinone oxidoreductase subunit H [Methanorbis furvi]|uniref:NAD(P)H-quinone oxidoreductase subunit 1, chloroplastic n=1 Tax=Methanorbis furvi TaxID=3028299 RepID=A0AAE4MBM2_9EURY|nr:NAD(P)H-quinone oxidoreductase subunit 1, chloroplastic [Methanocorpusculaceae archaeon Ag1]